MSLSEQLQLNMSAEQIIEDGTRIFKHFRDLSGLVPENPNSPERSPTSQHLLDQTDIFMKMNVQTEVISLPLMIFRNQTVKLVLCDTNVSIFMNSFQPEQFWIFVSEDQLLS